VQFSGEVTDAVVHRVGTTQPVFEISRRDGDSISYLVAFGANAPLAITESRSIVIAELELSATGATRLTLDPQLTLLADAGGMRGDRGERHAAPVRHDASSARLNAARALAARAELKDENEMNRIQSAFRILLLLAFAFPATHAIAQAVDHVTFSSVAGNGTLNVPVYIRDSAGTPLGIDQPAGSRIQSYSIRMTCAPASAVQSITFTRAGITAPLTPTFESSPAAPGSVALLDNFDETTNLIPFTSNAALPGNQVGQLLVTLAPGVIPGTFITLTLDPLLTQLTDEGGTPATVETVANGRLALVNGSITVTAAPAAAAAVPTVGQWGLLLLTLALALVALLRT
jgi:hypothetical protein